MPTKFEQTLREMGFTNIGKDSLYGYDLYVNPSNRYGSRRPEFTPPICYIPSVQFLILKVDEKNPEIFDVALHLLSTSSPPLDNKNSETFFSGKLDKDGNPIDDKSKELTDKLEYLSKCIRHIG